MSSQGCCFGISLNNWIVIKIQGMHHKTVPATRKVMGHVHYFLWAVGNLITEPREESEFCPEVGAQIHQYDHSLSFMLRVDNLTYIANTLFLNLREASYDPLCQSLNVALFSLLTIYWGHVGETAHSLPIRGWQQGVNQTLDSWPNTMAITVQVIKLSDSRGAVEFPTYYFSGSVVLQINFHMDFSSLTAAAHFIFILPLPPVKKTNMMNRQLRSKALGRNIWPFFLTSQKTWRQTHLPRRA